MALYNTLAPKAFNPSKNDLLIGYGTTTTVTDYVRLAFVVQIKNLNTGLWEDVYTGEQRFDSNSQTVINVADICDNELAYFNPQPYDFAVNPSRFVIWQKQCRLFRLKLWQTNDEAGTTTYSPEFRVIKMGGVLQQVDYNDITNHTGIIRTTINPVSANVRQLFANLSWLSAMDLAGFKVKYTFAYTDGTFLTGYYTSAAYPDLKKGDVINLFVPVHDYSNVSTVTYSITDSSNVVQTDTNIVLRISTRKYPDAKVFSYINGLGSTNVLYMPCNMVVTSEIKRESYQRLEVRDRNLPSSFYASGDLFQDNQVETILAQVDTGLLEREELDALRGALVSPIRYELYFDSDQLIYVPVILNGNKQQIANNVSKVPLPLNLEIVRAFNSTQLLSSINRNPSDAAAIYSGKNTAPSETFYMVIESAGGVFEMTHDADAAYINWGDGTIEENTSGGLTHIYAAGTYLLTGCFYAMMPAANFTVDGNYCRKFYGNISSSIIHLVCSNQGCTQLPALPKSLTVLAAISNNLTTLPAMPENLSIVNLNDNAITSIDINNLSAALEYLDLSSNALTVADVNAILVALDGFGLSSGVVILNNQTPTAAPSGAGATAKTSLLGKGWTVTTD